MLNGTRVLSISQFLAGPIAARMLGDLGAEVIKIENIDRGDPYRYTDMPYDGEVPEDLTNRFLQYNRGKRSLALDLTKAQGQEILRMLASDADVLIENQRAGQMSRFDLGYDDLRSVNDDLVYCSISGYGETGPYHDQPAMDGLIQAASGLARHNTIWAEEPVFSGLYIADYLGGIYAATSVLAGLVSMLKDRGGTHIDVSLLDAIVSLYGHEAAEYSTTGNVSTERTVAIVPYGLFKTDDGLLALCVPDHLWDDFCEVLEFNDWLESGRFDDPETRQSNNELIENRVQETLSKKPTNYWEDALLDAGVLAAPANSVEEVFNHPQVEHRQTVRSVTNDTLGEFITPIFPALFSNHDVDASKPVPRFGEHTETILSEIGYSENEITQFRQEGIISTKSS